MATPKFGKTINISYERFYAAGIGYLSSTNTNSTLLEHINIMYKNRKKVISDKYLMT